MERPFYDFRLLLAGKSAEVDRISGNADSKSRVLFGVIVSIDKRFAVEHIDVEVVCALQEITVQQTDKISISFLVRFAESIRHY